MVIFVLSYGAKFNVEFIKLPFVLYGSIALPSISNSGFRITPSK